MVLTNRKHIIALEPMDKGLSGTLLRYLMRCVLRTSSSMQFRTSKSKDMLDLARHIVNQKVGHFEPVRGPYRRHLGCASESLPSFEKVMPLRIGSPERAGRIAVKEGPHLVQIFER
ncbi:MAG: end-binding protein Ku [Bradyrhizobium sp.]